ncbi:hypothetical protein VTP01DRAFT_5181 [Rhizomucor pusillus]|uniref:uncharacterized protein n=1 Tax=Rhizomucor pusillus TaxID=4840 RepID=UPI0037420C73
MPGETFGFRICRNLQYHPEHYIRRFGSPDDYRAVRSFSQWYDGPRDAEHWMPMPLLGYVLANAYKRPIYFFSTLDSYTFLPDNAPPNNNSPVSSLLMKHSARYVNIRLALVSPNPRVIKPWKRHATKDSLAWEHRLTKPKDLEDILNPSQRI